MRERTEKVRGNTRSAPWAGWSGGGVLPRLRLEEGAEGGWELSAGAEDTRVHGPPGILGLELTGEDQQDVRAGKATSWTARLGLLRKVDLRTLLLPVSLRVLGPMPSSWQTLRAHTLHYKPLTI